MSKVIRISGLFFVSVLLFISVSTGNNGLLTHSLLQSSSQPANSDSYFSIGKLDLYFLNRPEERTIFSVRNLPVPYLKKYINDLKCSFLSYEKRKFNTNSRYLSYSVRLQPSLTNNEIIFPFHYFW